MNTYKQPKPKKERGTFTLSKEVLAILKNASDHSPYSMSALIEQMVKDRFADKRKEIRDQIKNKKMEMARLCEEWARLFPNEDIFPKEY
jgi:superfamily II RNA helicase